MGHNKERARLESTGKFFVLNSNTQALCQINKIRNLGVGPKNYKSPPGYCVARNEFYCSRSKHDSRVTNINVTREPVRSENS